MVMVGIIPFYPLVILCILSISSHFEDLATPKHGAETHGTYQGYTYSAKGWYSNTLKQLYIDSIMYILIF